MNREKYEQMISIWFKQISYHSLCLKKSLAWPVFEQRTLLTSVRQALLIIR
jgi:hypothetical protein